VVRSNLTGGFIFMREVYTAWMEAHGGAIVNIIADIWNGWPNFAHSAAARGGMHTLTECAACEWGRIGRAGQHRGARRHHDKRPRHLRGQGRRIIRRVAEQVPMQRFGTEFRGLGRDHLPAFAGGRLHHRSCMRVDGGAPKRARIVVAAEGPCAQRLVRRFPSGRNAQHPGPMSLMKRQGL